MSERKDNKRIKFTADNVDYYEAQFRLEHDRAMGYIPRTEPVQPQEVPLNVLANQTFPVPFELHETFRAWINRNKLARFDCFQEPNWNCPCYKCETFRTRQNEDLDLQETYMDAYMTDAIMGSTADEPSTDKKMSVDEAAAYAQESSVVVPHSSVVCHFFSELPQYEGKEPTTPKFSTCEFYVPDSDHGKEAAQQHWIRLMQMTPTKLTF